MQQRLCHMQPVPTIHPLLLLLLVLASCSPHTPLQHPSVLRRLLLGLAHYLEQHCRRRCLLVLLVLVCRMLQHPKLVRSALPIPLRPRPKREARQPWRHQAVLVAQLWKQSGTACLRSNDICMCKCLSTCNKEHVWSNCVAQNFRAAPTSPLPGQITLTDTFNHS